MSYTLKFFIGCSIYVCSCSTPSFSSPANSSHPFQVPLFQNTWVLVSWSYLVALLLADRLAAVSVCLAELTTCASAYVSDTVTSQAKVLPLDHGRMVESSGRLPSCRIKPTGSLRAWIWARFKSLQIIIIIIIIITRLMTHVKSFTE